MTYEEAIEKFVKNEECREFLLFYYGECLDCNLPGSYSDSKMLAYLFKNVGYKILNSLLVSDPDSQYEDYLRFIHDDILKRNVARIYDWKSIKNWLLEIDDVEFGDNLLRLYDELVYSMRQKGYGKVLDRFIGARVHNLSTAVLYFSYMLRKHWGFDSLGEDEGVRSTISFLIGHGRMPNDFDD